MMAVADALDLISRGDLGPPPVAFTMPMRLVNPLNAREHWAKRARRVKSERATTILAFRCAARGTDIKNARAFVVVLTRISPKPFDAHDGLRAAFKAHVDGITDALGLKSDADNRVRWVYRQERGKPKEHAVVVQVYST